MAQITIGEFTILEPVPQTIPPRITIYNEAGEGGEFLKQEFDTAVRKSIHEFFEENF